MELFSSTTIDYISDVFSRKILKWRLFNTMDAFYYVQLLEETI